MTSRFFRTADTNELHHHRRDQLERMAESMLAFAEAESNGHDFAIDMPVDDEMLWNDWGQEHWGDKLDAFNDPAEGGLDLLGMLLKEGVSEEKINLFYKFNDFDLAEELAEKGFHFLHFRMNFPKFQDRMFYTFRAAYRLKDTGLGLETLSLTTSDDAEAEVNACSPDSDSPFSELSQDDLYALFRLDSRKAPKWSVESYYSAVDKYLSAAIRNAGSHADLAQVIEKAFQLLVYNFGYRLKLMGYDNVSILDEVATTIDYLIAKVTDDRDFSEGLKRQVLINLFSAFPAGLSLFDTTHHDLSGNSKDKRVLDHPLSEAFRNTLLGPLHLFQSSRSTCPDRHRVTPMLNFFKEAGYNIDFEVSRESGLQSFIQANVLLESSHPLPNFLNSKEDSLFFHRGSLSLDDVKLAMLDPEVISKYPETIAIEIIASSSKILSRMSASSPVVRFSKYIESRDDVRASSLYRIAELELLDHGVFKSLNGNAQDLKRLGNLAPEDLREKYLSADLGL